MFQVANLKTAKTHFVLILTSPFLSKPSTVRKALWYSGPGGCTTCNVTIMKCKSTTMKQRGSGKDTVMKETYNEAMLQPQAMQESILEVLGVESNLPFGSTFLKDGAEERGSYSGLKIY